MNHGAYSLALARVGFDKAKEPEVKLFAERLLTDHQRANETLQRLAAAEGAQAAGDLPADRRDAIHRLAQASGNAFDARFLDLLGIRAQRDEIALYESAIGNVKNRNLREFAQHALPSLRRHLSAAQELQRAQAQAETANPMP
jgi:putative membrane protein